MISPIVRRAEPKDFEQLCRLYVAFHEFHVQGVPDRLSTLGSPDTFECNDLLSALQQLHNRSDVALFVAVTATQVIGLAEVYIRQDEESDAKIAYRYGYLQSLMVLESFRQHHIGTRLVEAAQEWAVHQGATEMRLEIWEFDAGPLPFYERLGYRTLQRILIRPVTKDTLQK
jgi:GNAT superfamily N-acetyltransferase